MSQFDKLVIVTRKTALEELLERFNTRDQARFYIEHMGGRFEDYQAAHDAYHQALVSLRANVPRGVRNQWIERSFLPTFTFGDSDVVVILGQDGLVVNAAKYLNGQLVVALNPDPARIDGVLLPFDYHAAHGAIALALSSTEGGFWREVTMAKATLNNGQSLLAVNDFFIGQKTHVSARYQIRFNGREENQSSSGIIVSTGAGSTGWNRSILTGAAGIVEALAHGTAARPLRDQYRFDWEARHLVFNVREPFLSKSSGAEIVHGEINTKHPFEVISQMPRNGVIFSDGVEEDHLEFTSGAIAKISVAERTLRLVVPANARSSPHESQRSELSGRRKPGGAPSRRRVHRKARG
jgi:NAD kinase